jgi:tetratricopeptide (TPR) repeat protein
MQLFTPSRRGLLAATVAAVILSLGCGTTAPRTGPAPPPASSEALTPSEDRRAQALAHYGAALSIAAEQGMTEALPEYLQSYELDPQNLSLALWLGQIYRDRHDATNSLAILDKAIKAIPKSGEPWVAKGITYQTIDDLSQALVCFQHALKVEPTHYGAIRALVDTYLTENDTNSVIAQLEYAVRQRSDDADYWVAIGDLYNRILRQYPSWSSRLDRARSRQCYEKALAIAPRDPDILARVGDSYMDADNFKAAADAYARLMEVRPNLPQLRERLAALYLKTDQKEKAFSLYKELIKRDPLRYEFYNDLGELYEELPTSPIPISACANCSASSNGPRKPWPRWRRGRRNSPWIGGSPIFALLSTPRTRTM